MFFDRNRFLLSIDWFFSDTNIYLYIYIYYTNIYMYTYFHPNIFLWQGCGGGRGAGENIPQVQFVYSHVENIVIKINLSTEPYLNFFRIRYQMFQKALNTFASSTLSLLAGTDGNKIIGQSSHDRKRRWNFVTKYAALVIIKALISHLSNFPRLNIITYKRLIQRKYK